MFSNINKPRNFSVWKNYDPSSSLKLGHSNLITEVSKLKNMNESLQKEKKNLEIRLCKAECLLKQIKNNTKQRRVPEEIEILLSKVDTNIKSLLYSKIEYLLQYTTCIVCDVNLKSVMYDGCKHLIVCSECSVILSDICPVCRKQSEKIPIYL